MCLILLLKRYCDFKPVIILVRATNGGIVVPDGFQLAPQHLCRSSEANRGCGGPPYSGREPNAGVPLSRPALNRIRIDVRERSLRSWWRGAAPSRLETTPEARDSEAQPTVLGSLSFDLTSSPVNPLLAAFVLGLALSSGKSPPLLPTT